MSEFLDLSDKARLNQEEINDSNKGTDTEVKSFPSANSSGTAGFTAESTQPSERNCNPTHDITSQSFVFHVFLYLIFIC